MDIESYFRFENAGRTLADLDTPVPVIDLDIVAANLARWQARCDMLGIANRPHIKTHKLVPLALAQLGFGARGITVQKLGEAEIMARAGISDILLTFNVVGERKVERLGRLAKTTAISTVADNADILAGLSQAGQAAGRRIDVLVECDTGMHRNGVQGPQAAAQLARAIESMPGLRYGGLLTYPKAGTRKETAAFLTEASRLAAAAGLQTRNISSGGTPDMWLDDGLAGITEYRAGTYVYFDRSQVERGACGWSDCALTVLSTVVSRPTPERAMIDAGSKSLTSDLLGLTGHGVVSGDLASIVYDLSEEHGFVDVTRSKHQPRVGDRLRIVPNHVCPVVNLFDTVVFVRGERVIGSVRVDARGAVQ
jgi:D-serine deaminase-like pyridoxal phosphate-dependent protein